MKEDFWARDEDAGWPEPGDKLLMENSTAFHTATIHPPGNAWYQYIVSYKRSADVLMESAVFIHHEDILVLECGTCREGSGNFDGHCYQP